MLDRRATRAAARAQAAFAPLVASAAIVMLPMMAPIASSANVALVDLAIAAAIAASLWWAAASRVPLKAPYALPVGLTAVGGTFAAMRSQFPLAGGQAVLQDLFLLAWAIALANLGRSHDALSTLTKAWSYSATLWAAALVVATVAGDAALSGASHATGGRAAFTFGNENTASVYYAISLIVVLACRRPQHPIARAAAAVTILVAAVLTGSLAGLLGLLAGGLVIVFIGIRRRWGMAPAVVVLTVALLMAGTGSRIYQDSGLARGASTSSVAVIRFTLGRTSWSAGARETLARETAAMYRAGDLVGIGPASTKLTLAALQAPYVREAHNDWTAALLERGVLGAIGASALFAVFGFYTITTGARSLRDRFADVVPAPWLLIGILPIVLVFSLTHEALHDRTVWTILGLIAALHLWCRALPAPITPMRTGGDE
jgi:hypothetical protein